MLRQRLHIAWLGSVYAAVALLSGCSVDDGLSAADAEHANYRNETSTNWSMARGYPRNTAFNPFEQELAPDTVSSLQQLWSAANSAPSLIQHADLVYASTGQAYGIGSGTLLWTADTLLNPVFCKGLVFSTGQAIQGYAPSTGGLAPNDNAMLGATTAQFGLPTAKDSSLLYAGVTDSWASESGAAPGRYVTYDVSLNSLGSVDLPFSYRTLAPAALTAGQLYAPALVPVGSTGGSPPVDGAGFDYAVFASTFDSTSDSKRKDWMTVIDQNVAVQLPTLGVMVIGARVFGASAAGDAVFGLDQRSGSVDWRTPTSERVASLAASFDYVYAAGSDSQGQLVLEAFSTGSGKSRFAVKLGTVQLTGQLALGGDVLYVGTGAGELVALDATNGTVLKRVQLGGGVGDPIVTGGRVVVATGARIVALGLPPAPAPATP